MSCKASNTTGPPASQQQHLCRVRLQLALQL
jgi:hypothetical protein